MQQNMLSRIFLQVGKQKNNKIIANFVKKQEKNTKFQGVFSSSWFYTFFHHERWEKKEHWNFGRDAKWTKYALNSNWLSIFFSKFYHWVYFTELSPLFIQRKCSCFISINFPPFNCWEVIIIIEFLKFRWINCS